MRYVKKSSPPAALVRWMQENRNLGLKFDDNTFPKKEVMAALTAEQQGLCAYTMKQLDAGAHIEHIHPQSRFPEKATDYNNMCACCTSDAYGAKYKGNSTEEICSPHRSDVEGRFVCMSDGVLKPRDDCDTLAQATVRVLNLNHESLVLDRRQAMDSVRAQWRRCFSAGKIRRYIETTESCGRLPSFWPCRKKLLEMKLRQLQSGSQHRKRSGNTRNA